MYPTIKKLRTLNSDNIWIIQIIYVKKQKAYVNLYSF